MVLMASGDEAKPHCPNCGAICRLQIKGVSPEHSQYKCPECKKTYQGAALDWW